MFIFKIPLSKYFWLVRWIDVPDFVVYASGININPIPDYEIILKECVYGYFVVLIPAVTWEIVVAVNLKGKFSVTKSLVIALKGM